MGRSEEEYGADMKGAWQEKPLQVPTLSRWETCQVTGSR